jgi:hypothetical protein
MVPLRCFYRVDLSVHAMVFVKGNWLFCACDGAMVQLRCFDRAKEISKQAGKQARSTG